MEQNTGPQNRLTQYTTSHSTMVALKITEERMEKENKIGSQLLPYIESNSKLCVKAIFKIQEIIFMPLD